MKKKSFVLIVVSLVLCFLANAEIPDNLLEKSDLAYVPSTSKFHLLIESYEKNIKKQYYDLDAYVKGNGKYLVIYNNPAIMKGQGQLRLDKTIYMYVRKTDRLQQVSARTNFYQTVLSQEDVMSSMLSYLYNTQTVEETELDGKNVYKLTLLAKEKRCTYSKIITYIDVETLLPVKRLFYSYSDQLIKESIIEEVNKENGKMKYVRFRVVNSSNTSNYSIVEMKDFDDEYEITDEMFSVGYLKAHVK